jgi:tryptophanase
MPKTLIEPFRIKSVEPIRMTTRAERERLLEEAKLNVFKLRAEDVLIDWLTDSGTGAMSSRQWGAIMEGDESYAGARSFYRLEKVIQDITGMPYFVPTHQGRAAEKVLFGATCKAGDLVPNNCHFDTTRGNLEYMGVEAVDLVIPEGLQPALDYPFKGNIDLARVEAVLKEQGHRIPLRHDHRDQQHGRRPAGVHGQHPRLCRAAQEIRQALHHGRVPLLGKRHVHQDARARLREHADQATS